MKDAQLIDNLARFSLDKNITNYQKNIEKNSAQSSVEQNVKTQTFAKVLQKELADNLKISKHAKERLEQRNIKLNDDCISRLRMGIEKADRKGIKNALVIVDENMFIVNVNSKTLVTGINKSNTNTFTNIDGALVV